MEKHYNYVQLCTWCVPVFSLNYFYSSKESWLSKENNSTSHERQLLLQNLTRDICEKGRSLHNSNSMEDKERNPFAEKAVFTTLAAKAFLSHPHSNCYTLSTPSVRSTSSQSGRDGIGSGGCPFYSQLSTARDHLFCFWLDLALLCSFPNGNK